MRSQEERFVTGYRERCDAGSRGSKARHRETIVGQMVADIERALWQDVPFGRIDLQPRKRVLYVPAVRGLDVSMATDITGRYTQGKDPFPFATWCEETFVLAPLITGEECASVALYFWIFMVGSPYRAISDSEGMQIETSVHASPSQLARVLPILYQVYHVRSADGFLTAPTMVGDWENEFGTHRYRYQLVVQKE
jgi:hypothetical protein